MSWRFYVVRHFELRAAGSAVLVDHSAPVQKNILFKIFSTSLVSIPGIATLVPPSSSPIYLLLYCCRFGCTPYAPSQTCAMPIEIFTNNRDELWEILIELFTSQPGPLMIETNECREISTIRLTGYINTREIL